jgi:lipopolysaccharide transport system ATP-binding protein
MSDLLIKAEHVSKKFCRSLKRSLWYGMKDVTHSLNPWARSQEMNSSGEIRDRVELRPDEFWALQDISFEVRRGECLGLIGHNGAGKSTLLKILNGLIRPDAGRITMRGRVGALIELSAGFNPILSGRENIFNQASLLGFSKHEIMSRFDEIVEFSELADFLDMPIQNYSSGMKVRLGFAVAVHLKPDVLIIDEVLAVGDAGFRFKCMNAMSEILRNAAVVFVSHSMPQVVRVSTAGLVLDHGRVSYNGSDVGEAIDTYYSKQQNPEERVTGSGDAVILAGRISSGSLSAETGDVLRLNASDGFRVDLEVSFTNRVTAARVQAVLWNQEMIPVAEIVCEGGLGFIVRPQDPGRVVSLSFTVPPPRLNGGKYMMTISVVSEDYRFVYCRHDNVAILNVSNSNVSGANCILPARWELQSKAVVEVSLLS